ncbi:hypothetical protein BJX70DRAFT_395480 [Aspergillus crustosus]
MSLDKDTVKCNGFIYTSNKFLAITNNAPQGIERVDGPTLKRMFLPTLTPEAQKALRDEPDFVRGQLKHYGVSINESQFSGNGTVLLKKALQWLGKGLGKKKVTGKSAKANGVKKAGRGRPATKKVVPVQEGEDESVGEGEGEGERTKMHKDYAQASKRSKSKPSPVGGYVVDCKYIQEQWPGQADDLSLDIHETAEPDVFQASFDFGILEGVMIISTDAAKLEQYADQADRRGGYLDEEEYDSEEDEEDEDEEGQRPSVGSKMKAATPQRGRGRPKKANTEKPQPLTYQLKSRCRELEGQIYSQPDDGTLKFKKGLASFVGNASLPACGDLSFTARKVSDKPSGRLKKWSDYSEDQYEMERLKTSDSNTLHSELEEIPFLLRLPLLLPLLLTKQQQLPLYGYSLAGHRYPILLPEVA